MQAIRSPRKVASLQKQHLDNELYSQGTEGKVIAPEFRKQGDSDYDSQHDRNETAEGHDNRIEVITCFCYIMEPDQGGCVSPKAKECILAKADLPGISRYKVPSLGDDNMAKGKEQVIGKVGSVDIEKKRHSGKSYCNQSRNNDRSSLSHVLRRLN